MSRLPPAVREGHPTLWFALRFFVGLAALRLGYPLVAPGYKAAFGGAANVALWATEPGGRIELRFEPLASVPGPDHDRMAVLRVRDTVLGDEAHMRVDVRSFSYRPMATFVALLLAFRWMSWRRAARVAGVGLGGVALLTGALTAVAALRFGLGKVLGFGGGRIVETLYEALTTPAMVYALPIFVFWALVRWSGRRASAPRPERREIGRSSDKEKGTSRLPARGAFRIFR